MEDTVAPVHKDICRTDYPELDLICWHMGGVSHVPRDQAFAIYEANWAYVDVRRLQPAEIALITELAREFGKGLFAPKSGQPIILDGVYCV